ncbi:sugar-binding transcriptional regulator [Nonomuraea sp. NPDC004580]|uniref:sugar-binding transcriptional regulator n=1 Tax=Nonomuraea sp. NPDC004580 TaxID=3154552 RepID=UPI0033AFC6F5
MVRDSDGVGDVSKDHLRLLARVARMYHEQGIRQPEIAAALHLSQPRVSRLLKEAVTRGLVRTVVTLPEGVHTELEEELQRRYALRDAVVVDVEDYQDDVVPSLATAAAAYLDVTFTGGDVIGLAAWSQTLQAVVQRLPQKNVQVADRVIQLVGGLGSAADQVRATRLIARLADLTNAHPVFVPLPGLVATPATREALLQDPDLTEVQAQWREVTVALVGIGEPASAPVRDADRDELRAAGGVGEVCLHFFDATGKPVASDLDRRVIGIDTASFGAVGRRVAVAGGLRKLPAIRAALEGGWVNILVTDLRVARRLCS